MFFESILLAIFVCSFGAIIVILIRKIPVLHTMPKNGTTGIREHKYISAIEKRTKKVLVYFRKKIILHKFLSWVRIMTIKAESKIDNMLHKMRKKAQEIDKEIDNKD